MVAIVDFTESQVDASSFFPPKTCARLRAIKAKVDPGWMLRANHAIPPAGTEGAPA